MTKDIEYQKAVSIYREDGQYAITASSPCHKPGNAMAGMKSPDPNKIKRSLYLLDKLREKHGLAKRTEPEAKPEQPLPKSWRDKIAIKANQLPKRKVSRSISESTEH
ncbi:MULTISPECIES: hypothetical protein [unclassified Vibrio]|uniref:hypothetical protein n=1 Tax=unclassified Vibrio TaxID=2614977 RepID=UPI001361DECF|nr:MULTISPECIES: hypothetical protein [unclassified Vibrio]NAW58745.1 hypothetical protein [Vibrio sp. V36_P2S2PM302]NAX27178.1 hypothetical protein [Vibrio sp. V38_P2S17PM301]NAX31731.1 hypothetical protein [Vibrio sp. V37_P2S8PM304]